MNTSYQNGYVTRDQVEAFEMLSVLLNSMYDEFQELSKKKPQDILKLNKVRVVNRVLNPALALLHNEPTRPFLDLLEEDELPQNSDVILMLSQVQAALGRFESRYHNYNLGWHIDKKF